jgi:hypothetical protein
VAPEVNRRRAPIVLGKIAEILSWELATEHERDERFVELGEYLCEVLAGQYWRLENPKSFDESLEKRSLSRVGAYYLGWSKATELIKVAHRDGTEFDCAT